mmetsp:Transcript_1773/g.2039  ORF Transcript_1773/g.2039 Transcript_1773/m.2039 type:complete len:621 (+) Transcript_1773:117-1979(+)
MEEFYLLGAAVGLSLLYGLVVVILLLTDERTQLAYGYVWIRGELARVVFATAVGQAAISAILVFTVYTNETVVDFDTSDWIIAAVLSSIGSFIVYLFVWILYGFSVLDGTYRDVDLKKKPSLDTKTRVCVVGAGYSGMTAAWELKRMGYENITVFEANPHVGGKSLSVEIDGNTYQKGSVWITHSKIYRRYLKKFGIGGRDIISRPSGLYTVLDDKKSFYGTELNGHMSVKEVEKEIKQIEEGGATLKLGKLENLFFMTGKNFRLGIGRMFELLRLLIKLRSLRLATTPGKGCEIWDQDPEMSVSIVQWLRKHNFNYFAKIVEPMVMTSMSGYEVNTTSAIFNLRILQMFLRAPMRALLSMRFSRVKQGHDELCRRMAKAFPNDSPDCHVRLNSKVTMVTRNTGASGNEIHVQVEGEKDTYIFDKIIFAGSGHLPGQFENMVQDVTETERRLMSSISTIKRVVPLIRVKRSSIPRRYRNITTFLNRWVPETGILESGPLGAIVPHPECRVGSWKHKDEEILAIFPFFGENRSFLTAEEAVQGSVNFLERMGIEVIEVADQGLWDKYYPHFASDALQAGAEEEFESLQGKNNTYFVGEINSGVITVGAQMEYAAHFVSNFF